jgi:hypothetical protein
LGTAVTNEKLIQNEIMRRLNSGNACCHSVQSLLSSHRIYETLIFLAVLYGCETWSLTLREEQRLRVFENTLRRIFVPRKDEVAGEWRKLHNRSFVICSLHHI